MEETKRTDYIDREWLLNEGIRVTYGYNDNGIVLIPMGDVRESIKKAPAADVAPKSEVARLEKLLDDKCDRCIERERATVAREIFAEIRKEYELDGMTYLDEILCGHLSKFIAELEKKYTEVNHG